MSDRTYVYFKTQYWPCGLVSLYAPETLDVIFHSMKMLFLIL